MTKLEKLRIVELDILDEVVRICEKYDIKYFLAYGTLIGAIRHKGFIPWDDDIDIWMFREDYDRFAQIAQKELGDNYFYQDYITDPDYPYNFAKVRANDTRFVQTAIDHLDMHHGIYIDIFALDNARDNIMLEKCDWKYNKFLRTLASVRYMSQTRSGVERSFAQKVLIALVSIFVSKKAIHKKIDKEEKMLNNKNSKNIIYRSDINYTSFNKDDFIPDKTLFEGKYYCIPKGYDKILKICYGDYMNLPPENQRISNHETLEIDFGNYFKNN